MGTIIIVGIILAAVLVIASGIWVAAALIAALGRTERSDPATAGRTTDNSTTT